MLKYAYSCMIEDSMVCAFNMWALFMKDTRENTQVLVVIS